MIDEEEVGGSFQEEQKKKNPRQQLPRSLSSEV